MSIAGIVVGQRSLAEGSAPEGCLSFHFTSLLSEITWAISREIDLSFVYACVNRVHVCLHECTYTTMNKYNKQVIYNQLIETK